MNKTITLLGSTGSIGTQSLDVARMHGYSVFGLAANSSVDKLLAQIHEFHPRYVAVVDPAAYEKLSAALTGQPDAPKLLQGAEGLRELAAMDGPDIVLNAVVGIAGLPASLAAIESGHDLALANKESLVTGGHLVTDAVKKHGVKLLPVDSEHSAIFQCLQGAGPNAYEEILLTASGGPFRTWDRERMRQATVTQALGHPTWSMGSKITIDSASMFNKALEIIEAKWLFNARPEQIQVVVHPQSIVHSAVRFKDGAVIAQMGVPDMRLPILYAMTYPERLETGEKKLDLFALRQLTFEAPDTDKFPAIAMAYDALRAGGAAACVLNGANEEAAYAFLGGRIAFGLIPQIVDGALQRHGHLPASTLDEVLSADALARAEARRLIEKAK